MSRQLDLVREERETRRRDAVIAALEFGIQGALENQGIRPRGFSIAWNEYDCLLVLKGEWGGKWQVAFVGGGSAIECVLNCLTAAQHDRLRWKEDRYQPEKD